MQMWCSETDFSALLDYVMPIYSTRGRPVNGGADFEKCIHATNMWLFFSIEFPDTNTTRSYEGA
jgi:hypothetical protein